MDRCACPGMGTSITAVFMPESRSVEVKVEPSAFKGKEGRWRISVRRALQRSSIISISTGAEEATAGLACTAKYCSSASPSDSLSVSESVDSDVSSVNSLSGSPFVVLLFINAEISNVLRECCAESVSLSSGCFTSCPAQPVSQPR